jgi:hypothetical protein
MFGGGGLLEWILRKGIQTVPGSSIPNATFDYDVAALVFQHIEPVAGVQEHEVCLSVARRPVGRKPIDSMKDSPRIRKARQRLVGRTFRLMRSSESGRVDSGHQLLLSRTSRVRVDPVFSQQLSKPLILISKGVGFLGINAKVSLDHQTEAFPISSARTQEPLLNVGLGHAAGPRLVHITSQRRLVVCPKSGISHILKLTTDCRSN